MALSACANQRKQINDSFVQGALVTNDLSEQLEQTLAEMESQQLATQQLLADTLSELELLYQEMEQFQMSDQADDGAAMRAMSENIEPSEELLADLERVRGERDSLAEQLASLQVRFEELCSPQDVGSDDAASPDAIQLRQMSVPGGNAIRSPFERLRKQLEGGDTADTTVTRIVIESQLDDEAFVDPDVTGDDFDDISGGEGFADVNASVERLEESIVAEARNASLADAPSLNDPALDDPRLNEPVQPACDSATFADETPSPELDPELSEPDTIDPMDELNFDEPESPAEPESGDAIANDYEAPAQDGDYPPMDLAGGFFDGPEANS